MSAVRAVAVCLLVGLWTLALLPGQLLAIACRSRLAERIPVVYHKLLRRLLQVEIVEYGAPTAARPVLFVCNHVSWLDIVVLGSLLPASFIAKHEVAGWPFFGQLAKLQRSVFIERRWRATAAHRDRMQARLEAGDNLILFPEGTSGDGLHILPFKSAFLSLAERRIDGRSLTVQPLTLTYTAVDGWPVMRSTMGQVAWVGDTDLLSHLWGVLTGGAIRCELRFHDAVTIEDFAGRKDLSAHCRAVIMSGNSQALSARAA